MAEATIPAGDDTLALLQTRVRDLESVLNQNNAGISLTFQLTPAIANLLGLLLSLPLVTPEAIQHRLEIATDPKIAIHRLRKRLLVWHLPLEVKPGAQIVQGRRHVGYWIEPEMKAKMRAQIQKATEALTSTPAERLPS